VGERVVLRIGANPDTSLLTIYHVDPNRRSLPDPCGWDLAWPTQKESVAIYELVYESTPSLSEFFTGLPTDDVFDRAVRVFRVFKTVTRPWWRHPRWHIHHWRVHSGILTRLLDLLLGKSRCTICDGSTGVFSDLVRVQDGVAHLECYLSEGGD